MNGLPLPPLESAGMRAGFPEDASTGLPRMVDRFGMPWAQTMGQWMRVYTVQSGDSLSKIATQFYGNANWRPIRTVPQNVAIQGPSADTGLIPGDKILIPNLQQPSPAAVPPPEAPPTTIDVPPPDEVTFPSGSGVPSLPGGLPGDIEPILTGGPPVLSDTEPTPEPTPTQKPAPKKDKAMLIAGAIGVAALAIGTIALVSKRKRRQNPRRRRRS